MNVKTNIRLDKVVMDNIGNMSASQPEIILNGCTFLDEDSTSTEIRLNDFLFKVADSLHDFMLLTSMCRENHEDENLPEDLSRALDTIDGKCCKFLDFLGD